MTVHGADATAAYHDLLTDDIGGESDRVLEDQLRRRGMFFGGRALCTVLRPRFFSPRQYALLQRQCEALLGAFRRAHEATLEDLSLLEQFRLLDWERELVRIDHGFSVASPTSRLDTFFDQAGTSILCTEYNAETPAGAGFNDVLTEVFYSLPALRAFARGWDLRPLPARHQVLHALLSAYEEQFGAGRQPRIAIVDWRDVPSRAEFGIFEEYFARQGFECVIVDPADCEYANGALTAGGGRVDIIYKRVLLSELVERGGSGIDHPIFRAVRDRAVCMVNPPACKILHKKASLAVLSDERNAGLFDASQRRAIAASVPWTRVVEARETEYDGKRIDLLEYIASSKDDLVLKPNDEYGGKGIVLGWEVDDAEWQAAVKVALDEPYIVQRRIVLPTEPYPSFVEGKVVLADRMVDTAPFATYGAIIDGCLTRLGTTSLLNVTAGGGSQTPTFIVEQRR
jgi:uncharacterized circularly permuted ATP-grasp superfamily protein